MEKSIIIIDRNHGCLADDVLIFGFIHLQSFYVVIFIHGVAFDIIVMGCVLIDVAVPSVELIIDVRIEDGSVKDRSFLDVNTIVDLDSAVLVVLTLSIEATCLIGATKSFLFTVIMDGPNSINSSMNIVQ